METINNIANAASKAVFGEGAKQEPSTQEPRSGETGLGTPDSPYDKGNLDLGKHICQKYLIHFRLAIGSRPLLTSVPAETFSPCRQGERILA